MPDEHPAVVALRDRAVKRQKATGHALTFYTDATTFARGKKPAVLVALANRCSSMVLAIDAAEFDYNEQIAMANLFGFPDQPPPNALERLTKGT